MADIECPRCGHRALSVATRCPRCGHEFSEEQLRHRPPMPGRRPLRRGPAIGLGLAAAALGGVIVFGRGASREPGGSPPVTTTPAAADTVAALEPAPPSAAVPHMIPAPAAPGAAPVPPAAEVPALARRWASEWVNVRARRGGRSPVVRVLEPGDAVLVDSLRRGWYRVVDGGRTLGYAHRRFLTANPPRGTVP